MDNFALLIRDRICVDRNDLNLGNFERSDDSLVNSIWNLNFLWFTKPFCFIYDFVSDRFSAGFCDFLLLTATGQCVKFFFSSLKNKIYFHEV